MCAFIRECSCNVNGILACSKPCERVEPCANTEARYLLAVDGMKSRLRSDVHQGLILFDGRDPCVRSVVYRSLVDPRSADRDPLLCLLVVHNSNSSNFTWFHRNHKSLLPALNLKVKASAPQEFCELKAFTIRVPNCNHVDHAWNRHTKKGF